MHQSLEAQQTGQMARAGRYCELHNRQWERERYINPGEELPVEAGVAVLEV